MYSQEDENPMIRCVMLQTQSHRQVILLPKSISPNFQENKPKIGRNAEHKKTSSIL